MATIVKIEPKVTLPKKKKVAAYARVSLDTDNLLHSLSAQVSYYSKLIQDNPEWIYAGVYADAGISGTSTKGRKEFQKMIAECEKGNIDIILAKSISRFARNTVDLLNTVRHLKEIGIEVRFERENINTLSADGEMLLTILGGFAESESRSISENIRWAFRKKFERGEIWHMPPFGYRWDGKNFVIEENEAKIIRKVFDDFVNDVPLPIISCFLKESGHKHDKPAIKKILQNYAYIGRVITQTTFSVNRKKRKNEGQLPRYVIDDNHEPIVDKATFDLAQKKLEGNKEYAHLVCRVFGYRFQNGIFEIEPFEAKAVKLIYQYYLQGWGKVKISKELMKQGYCTRTGKLSRQIVDRVLDSDFYSGGIEVKGQYQYTLNFGHDAIVSKEDFIKVQEFRKIRRKVIGK